MATTNYNVIQLNERYEGTWQPGDTFIVPQPYRKDYRMMRFEGLKIQSITRGFGIFLHFEMHEWQNNWGPVEKMTDETPFTYIRNFPF